VPTPVDLGRAPIVDFDGTLARLAVDWAELREQLGVRSIDDLWSGPVARWHAVTAAETRAATRAEPVRAVVDALAPDAVVGVLTANSEHAVRAFLAGQPALAARVRAVAGRETLGGPKRDPRAFAAAFDALVAATAPARGGAPVVYCGDQTYELDLAAARGARAVLVRDATLHAYPVPGGGPRLPRQPARSDGSDGDPTAIRRRSAIRLRSDWRMRWWRDTTSS
jgi:phosphoglycolate phosphatase-like HAD superfamily hydrolase